MTAGVSTTGFVAAQYQDIVTEIETDEKANIDPGLDVDPDQNVGQLNGTFADREASIWQLLQIAFNANDPEAVEGWMQDAFYAMNNLTRLPATYSITAGSVQLNAATTLPAGSTASIGGQPGVVFATQTAVTSTIAGWYPVNFVAQIAGPQQCYAGTLNVIAGAVSGWTAVTNLTDAAPGSLVETDTQFRVRRRSSTQNNGGPAVGSIQGALLAVSGIQTAFVYENLLDNADPVSGNPAHSIEVLIYDGPSASVSNNVIAQIIWNQHAGGVTIVGNTSGIAVDANGINHIVAFSRPVAQWIWVTATINTHGAVPANAATLLAASLATAGNADLAPGATVLVNDLRSALYNLKYTTYTWVYDVPALTFGVSASPVNSVNLPMSIRQLPLLDSSRMVFNFVPV